MAEAEATKTARAKAPVGDTRTVFQRIIDITRNMPVLAPEKAPGGGIAFKYRGVDATVAHVTPLLNEHGVFITPSGIEHIVTENNLANGKTVKTSQVITTFTVYGLLGDSFEVQTAGLADDFSDRSAAQAQSVAYRVAILQLFHIPASGKDPEETGQVVEDGRAAPTARGPKAVEAAKASAAAASAAGAPLAKLQGQAKQLGKDLGKTPADLNALGAELSGGKEIDEWFVDAEVLTGIIAKLSAEKGAA